MFYAPGEHDVPGRIASHRDNDNDKLHMEDVNHRGVQ